MPKSRFFYWKPFIDSMNLILTMGKIGKAIALLLVILFLITLVLLPNVTAKAQTKTLVVPDQYPTIQSAIGNASAGDTVFVKKGNYTLTGLLYGLTIDKSISLIGQSRQDTILIQRPYRYNIEAIQVSADNVTISGFTIREGSNGILIDGSNCNIINNNIVDCYNNGIEVNGKDNVIYGNNILDNPDFGISMTANDSVISLNNLNNNGFAGIIINSSNVTVSQNTIVDNGNSNRYSNIPSDKKGGLILRWTGPYYVQGNNITNNYGFGIQLGEGCNTAIISNNNIFANQFGFCLLNYAINPSGLASAGSANQVYLNNIKDNTVNAIVEHTYNYSLNKSEGYIRNGTDVVSWDNSTVGNYWSDYTSQGSYVIDENNVDHHPLTQEVDISSKAEAPTVPELSWLIIVPLLLLVFSVAIVLRHRKTANY